MFLRLFLASVSSNVDEVIKKILHIFIQKFHKHKKAQNANKQTGIKNALQNM